MKIWPDDWFDQFWKFYPRRIAKKDAHRALERVRRSGELEFEKLIGAVQAFAQHVRGKELQYIPHPATWINGGRWDDELPAQQGLDDYGWRQHKRQQIENEQRRRRIQ